VNVGKLRHRVQHVRDTTASDDLGDMVPTPTTVGTYWGQVVTLSGREAVNAQQLRAETTHRVTLRWQGTSVDVKPGDKLVYNSRTFSILWVNNLDERNRQIDAYCTEVISPQ
jgi:SPP1 family predicted phage head-tail adaptor